MHRQEETRVKFEAGVRILIQENVPVLTVAESRTPARVRFDWPFGFFVAPHLTHTRTNHLGARGPAGVFDYDDDAIPFEYLWVVVA